MEGSQEEQEGQEGPEVPVSALWSSSFDALRSYHDKVRLGLPQLRLRQALHPAAGLELLGLSRQLRPELRQALGPVSCGGRVSGMSAILILAVLAWGYQQQGQTQPVQSSQVPPGSPGSLPGPANPPLYSPPVPQPRFPADQGPGFAFTSVQPPPLSDKFGDIPKVMTTPTGPSPPAATVVQPPSLSDKYTSQQVSQILTAQGLTPTQAAAVAPSVQAGAPLVASQPVSAANPLQQIGGVPQYVAPQTGLTQFAGLDPSNIYYSIKQNILSMVPGSSIVSGPQIGLALWQGRNPLLGTQVWDIDILFPSVGLRDSAEQAILSSG